VVQIVSANTAAAFKTQKRLSNCWISSLGFRFLLFYWASRYNWDYMTQYHETVNLNSNMFSDWNGTYYFSNNLKYITMQPNDQLYALFEPRSWNGTTYMGLIDVMKEREGMNDIVQNAYSNGVGELWFTSSSEMLVQVVVFSDSSNNVIPITTTLHHYETPQWGDFGIGIVLSSLAVIPIFKSKK
jgi:hypothetical protein